MIEAELSPLDPGAFRSVLDPSRFDAFESALDVGRDALEDRTLWHVNSTLAGGGVAELLSSVARYLIGSGIRCRWMALEGNDEFFVVTKRLHHLLHGKAGDGGHLGDPEASIYESALAAQCGLLVDQVRSGDVVVLHDPQPAGLAPTLRDLGARVIWACHVGADTTNEHTEEAWRFLLPAVSKSEAQVFSRRQYVWDGLDDDRIEIIPPCIDAFSPKNRDLEPDRVAGILTAAGVLPGPSKEARLLRQDGTSAPVSWPAELIEEAPIPPGAPVVTQVSRWDPLKDHSGLAEAFAEGVPAELGAHLVLAGPSPDAVGDDPEGQATLDDLRACVAALPGPAQRRTHIACLPMHDVEENATVVNALQRHARVVVQKSLAEGFGLTVAEAMWKGRPTVASAVGGICDQIEDGVSGILVEDPEDTAAFARAIARLLSDDVEAARLGAAGHTSVVDHHLAPTYLSRYLALTQRVIGG
ncbi:MAG: glycosyltransferase [Acidimicrobiales bacterium]